MSEEKEYGEDKKKTVYFVAEDELGWSFVAESKEKAREYASKDPYINDAETCEIVQVTDENEEPITLPERDFGYRIPIEEGLRKGAYAWAHYEVECEECGKTREYVHGKDGKLVCYDCKEEE